MQILNDTVLFTEADFSGLSVETRAAVVPYCGATPFHEFLSNLANAHLLTARRIAWTSAKVGDPVSPVQSYARVTEGNTLSVAQSLDSLAAALKDANVVPSPGDADIEPVVGQP
jgi:hypothetical protein